MPVPLRTHKAAAEARYNVTTECKYPLLVQARPHLIPFFLFLVPSLGLHSAAATGNVGLVEYALTRGQPINSVLGASRQTRPIAPF